MYCIFLYKRSFSQTFPQMVHNLFFRNAQGLSVLHTVWNLVNAVKRRVIMTRNHVNSAVNCPVTILHVYLHSSGKSLPMMFLTCSANQALLAITIRVIVTSSKSAERYESNSCWIRSLEKNKVGLINFVLCLSQYEG